MKNEELEKAILRVYDDLSKLSEEEFQKELEKHRDGDIANIILYTNALTVGEIESEFFADYSYYYPEALKTDIPNDKTYEVVSNFGILERDLTATSFVTEVPAASVITVNAFASKHTLENIWQTNFDKFSVCIPSQISLFESSLLDKESSSIMQLYSEEEHLFAHSFEMPISQSEQNRVFSIEDEEEYKLAA